LFIFGNLDVLRKPGSNLGIGSNVYVLDLRVALTILGWCAQVLSEEGLYEETFLAL